jgi:hypothetical protein
MRHFNTNQDPKQVHTSKHAHKILAFPSPTAPISENGHHIAYMMGFFMIQSPRETQTNIAWVYPTQEYPDGESEIKT